MVRQRAVDIKLGLLVLCTFVPFLVTTALGQRQQGSLFARSVGAAAGRRKRSHARGLKVGGALVHTVWICSSGESSLAANVSLTSTLKYSEFAIQ